MNTEPNTPQKLLSPLTDLLYVPDQKWYVCIRQSEIMLVKGARSSVELVLTGGNRRAVSTNLGRFLSYLNGELFVQVSRSYVINLLYVDAVQPGNCEVGGQRVAVTPHYRHDFNQRLTLVRLRPEVETDDSP